MVDLAAVKSAARRDAFARRKAAKEAAPRASDDAAARFLADIAVAPGEIVSGYRPIRSEIDPTPLMIRLHEQGAIVCAPVIDGPRLPLSFRVWTPDSEMIEGPFGAEIPKDGDWVEPTLLIAPLVAFDRQGWRLGYGGGFYDRTLALLRERRPTRAVGFAYAAQEASETPREPTDQRLDAIVTERETIRTASH